MTNMTGSDHSNQAGGAEVAARPLLNYALWTVQVLLALLFIFSGVMKLVTPLAKMQQGPVALPGSFLRFIGIAEILGGLGLVLPGMLRIRRGLTPLAAAGLVIIMVGATVITAKAGGAVILIPLVTGLLAAFVVWGRWPWIGRG